MTTENKTTRDETSPGNQKTDDTKQEQQKDTTKQPDSKQPDAVKELQEKLSSAEARIKELNAESEKRRKANKQLEEDAARKQKALDILAGKEGTETDPAELAKKATENKFRRLALKAAFVDLSAKEMHDSSFAFSAVERELADVKVDLETGEVDKEAITAKLTEMRTTRPFLFVAKSTSSSTSNPPPKGNPDGGGQPKGSSAKEKWNELRADPMRQHEAAEFWAKNRVAILADMK